jgi:hypothetical protein
MEMTGRLQHLVALSQAKSSSTQQFGGWVGLRTGVDIIEKRKISSPCW